VRRQRILDVGWIHVAAADGEHVDASVRQVEVAVGVEVAEITQRVPAVAGLGRNTHVAIGRRCARTGPVSHCSPEMNVNA
jgi:hypothetical protein